MAEVPTSLITKEQDTPWQAQRRRREVPTADILYPAPSPFKPKNRPPPGGEGLFNPQSLDDLPQSEGAGPSWAYWSKEHPKKSCVLALR
jgi:hypothetical protein